MHLLITNSSGGLCFQNKPIENNDTLITSSLIDSLQTISKKLYPSKLQKTTLNYKTIKIIVFSSIKNNFIFITKQPDIEITEDNFKYVYSLFIKEVLRDPYFNEDSFIKNKKFAKKIQDFLESSEFKSKNSIGDSKKPFIT